MAAPACWRLWQVPSAPGAPSAVSDAGRSSGFPGAFPATHRESALSPSGSGSQGLAFRKLTTSVAWEWGELGDRCTCRTHTPLPPTWSSVCLHEPQSSHGHLSFQPCVAGPRLTLSFPCCHPSSHEENLCSQPPSRPCLLAYLQNAQKAIVNPHFCEKETHQPGFHIC